MCYYLFQLHILTVLYNYVEASRCVYFDLFIFLLFRVRICAVYQVFACVVFHLQKFTVSGRVIEYEKKAKSEELLDLFVVLFCLFVCLFFRIESIYLFIFVS